MPPIELNTRMNEVPYPIGEALILMCSYRGAARKPRPSNLKGWQRSLIDVLTLPGLRSFVAKWRDFYANPRSAAYHRELVQAVAARCTPESEIIIDSALPHDAVPDGAFGEIRTSRRDLGVMDASALPAAPTVVMVFPDPLGLSWGTLEVGIAGQGRMLVAVNGRRRMFLLDKAARRGLAIRRLLANTRVVELTLGLALIPVAGLLALKDRIAGRT